MQDPSVGELEFESDVPHDLICSICLLPASDPQQTRCACAMLYCLECMKKYNELSKNCPTCRKPLDVFPDGLSARRIKGLKVKCSNSNNGCPWANELGDLRAHLGTCECATVPCQNGCGETMLRKTASLHDCPLQRFSCPHCKEVGILREMTGSGHLDRCPDLIVTCPNGCGTEGLARKDLGLHRTLCPKEAIGCPYAVVGCPSTFHREDLESHKADSLQHHLDLAMLYIMSTFRSQVEAVASLETSVRPLLRIEDTAIAQLDKRLSSLEAAALVSPVVFRMSDFAKHKGSKEPWYSPGFYTHPGGYRACLRVYANGFGDAEGTNLSAFVNLMRGKNDQTLVWPLRADFTITLLNQLKDGEHKEYVASMHHDSDEKYNARVVGTEVGSSARGLARFIPHQDLQPHKHHHYLKGGALYFRVDASVHPACKPWLLASN